MAVTPSEAKAPNKELTEPANDLKQLSEPDMQFAKTNPCPICNTDVASKTLTIVIQPNDTNVKSKTPDRKVVITPNNNKGLSGQYF